MSETTAPIFPTNDDVEAAYLTWEYEIDLIDISEMADPLNSRLPIQRRRRRLVSKWELYDPQPK